MLQPSGSIFELCHVVADLDEAIGHWTRTLGAGPFFVASMHLPDGHRKRGVPAPMAIKVGFAFSGGVLIELIEPLEGDGSIFTEALAERGPGFHHVLLRVDYDEGFARLTEQGFALVTESLTPLGERCALFDTRAVNNGYVEIMDLQIAFGRLTGLMADAHANWDGSSDPVRPLEPLFAQLGSIAAS